MIFNNAEWKILLHKLEQPEIVADALCDAPFTKKWYAIKDRAFLLSLVPDFYVDTNDSLNRLILNECCSGCTFFGDFKYGVVTGNISQQFMNDQLFAAQSLSNKLNINVATD